MADDKVQKVPTGALERPAFIPVGDTTGLEGVDKADIQLPRLGLAQGLSPEITPGKSQFIEGLKNGDYFNNLTKEIYGAGPLHVIIIRRDPPRFVEFNPLTEGGGIRDFDVPADDPRTKFTKNPTDGKSVNPLATKFQEFVALLIHPGGRTPEMLVLSFKSTGLKAARRLNGLMQVKMAPMYAGLYSFKVGQMTNSKGTFNVHVIDNAGFVGTEELYNFAKKQHENLVGKSISFQREAGDESPEDVEEQAAQTGM